MQPEDIIILRNLEARVLGRARLHALIVRRLERFLKPRGIRLSFAARRRVLYRRRADIWFSLLAQEGRSSTFQAALAAGPLSGAETGLMLKIVFLSLDQQMGSAFTLEERLALSRLAAFLRHRLP